MFGSKPKDNVAIVYKNFAIRVGISHIGLGVAALNNAKVLTAHGIKTAVLATVTPASLMDQISTSYKNNIPFSHVIVSAPWIPTIDLQKMCQSFPDTMFFVNCHSNVGFLQADSNGVKLLREYIDLEQGQLNFQVAGNSRKFVLWLRRAYKAPCAYLPNCYSLDYSNLGHPRPQFHSGGVLRIGAFGAVRPQKNLMTAAGAALVLANDLKTETEFWISGGRTEGGGQTIVNAIKEMLSGVPGITLKELNWRSWSQFRDLVRRMDLLLQVSYTESFNMVTADGIAEGVPSVVSKAIDWTPENWRADFDDVLDIVRVGKNLLHDKTAMKHGLRSLEKHNADGFRAWALALNPNNKQRYGGPASDIYNLG